MNKDDGEKMIYELERISSEVIVSTPHDKSMFSREKDPAIELTGNPLERHVSRWEPRDFREKGFKVYGVGFSLFGYYSTPKLNLLLQGLAHIFPSLGLFIVARKKKGVKDKTEGRT